MPRALAAALAVALAGLMALAPVGGAAPAKHPGVKVHHRAKAHGKAKTRHRSTRRCKAKTRAKGRLRCAKKTPRRGPARSARPTAPALRPTTTAPPSAPAPVPATAPAAPAQPVSEPLGSFASIRVSDSATNFSFSLSRPAVAAGRVQLQLQNRGEDPHDLTVAPEAGGAPLASTDSVDPGQSPTLNVDLPAGRYRLYCSLANHAQRGMRATLEAR